MATINFGDIELNKEDFLTSAANDVNEYVQQQAWSSKRKNMFMDAYNDLMAQNITGAKVIDGSWHILYDNDQIDQSKMSNKQKQMYKEAAWYIKSKMEENLPSKKETQKEEVKAFNNSDEFKNYIKRYLYGDQDFTINQWNNRDFIGDNGLRGTDNRKKALIGALGEYSKYLDTKDFDYSNTPYGTKENLQTAIANAINALNNNGDYNDALNRLGLNPQDWLSDGSNDIVATDENGRDITRAEYNQLQELATQKEDDSKTNTEQEKVDDGFRIRKTNWRVGTPISVKTLTERFGGDDQKIYNKLADYFNRGVNNLSEDENKELEGIYQYLAKSPISDDEYKLLQRFQSLKSRQKNDFRKLNGVDGLYWDNKANQVVQVYNKNKIQLDPNYGKSLLPKAQTEEEKQDKEKQAYLNSTGSNGGFSAAEWEELAAIGLDIASIINPEPFSAAAMSLGAAGSRNLAKAQQPGKWNVRDYIGQGLDYLTSVVGAVPIVGDAVLAGKVIKGLRMFARSGAWIDSLGSTPGMIDIWNKKIMGDEKMTLQDWRTIGTFLRGLVSHGRLNRSNLAARKVMQESGVDVTPENISGMRSRISEFSKKTGFTATPQSQNIPTLKLTNTGGEEVNLPIAKETKQQLQKAFKGKKPSERTEIARNNSKVKQAAEEAGVDLNNFEVAHSNSLRNINRFTRATVGKTNDSFGSTTISATSTKTNEEFENFLSNRGFGNKLLYGSNSALRRQRSILGLDKTPTTTASSTESSIVENPVSPLRPSNPEEGRLLDIRHGVVTNDRQVVSRPYKAGPTKQAKTADKKLIREVLKKGKYTDEFANEGVITFKGPDGNTHRLEVSFSKDGNNYNVTRTSSDGSQSAAQVRMEELKSYVAKQLQEIQNGKRNDVQLARLIRELRKSKFGWLKQGGKFNLDKEISNFLKEISV